MNSDVIPFYGSWYKDMFAIERSSMDRQGKVIAFLNKHLPQGLVLDIGAGDGFTAKRIIGRDVFCLEPSTGMVNFDNSPFWVRGSAEDIPFHDSYFDAAYSTWAYFFAGNDKRRGLKEAERVIKSGGKLIVVDNAGKDEFSSFAVHPIAEGPEFYLENGFTVHYIETAFEFASIEDAEALMSFYFGDRMKDENIRLSYEYRVAAYMKTV